MPEGLTVTLVPREAVVLSAALAAAPVSHEAATLLVLLPVALLVMALTRYPHQGPTELLELHGAGDSRAALAHYTFRPYLREPCGPRTLPPL